MKSSKITFITADEHYVVTKAVAFFLNEIYKYADIYQAHTIKGVLDILRTTKVDLLILDIFFPEGEAINVIKTLKKIQPKLKILVFSGSRKKDFKEYVLNAGADFFLSKSCSESEIKQTIINLIH